MGNLNDGVLDDIDSSQHSDDFNFIEPKTSNSAPDIDIVIPTKTNGLKEERQPTPQELFGPHVKPGEVPDVEAQFAVIDDHQTKIINLEEVESAIIGEGGISKTSAEHFNHYFPGFLDKIPLNRFTQLPTKVHYNEFLCYAKEEIANVKNQVTVLSSEFIISMSNAIEAYEDYLEDHAVPYIHKQVESLSSMYGDFISGVKSESKINVPVTRIKPEQEPDENTVEKHQLNKVEFIDLLQFPIYDYDHNIVEVPKLKTGSYTLVRFMSGMASLKPAIMSPELLYFTSDTYGINDGLIDRAIVYAQKPRMNDISLKDVFTFYNSGHIADRTNDLLNLIEGCEDAVEKLTHDMSQRGFITVNGEDDSKTIAPIQNADYSAMNAFLNENRKTLEDVIFTYNYVREIVHHFTQMNNALVDIIPALKQLS